MATSQHSIARRPSQDPARAAVLEAKVHAGFVLSPQEARELSWIWIARNPDSAEYRMGKHLIQMRLRDRLAVCA